MIIEIVITIGLLSFVGGTMSGFIYLIRKGRLKLIFNIVKGGLITIYTVLSSLLLTEQFLFGSRRTTASLQSKDFIEFGIYILTQTLAGKIVIVGFMLVLLIKALNFVSGLNTNSTT